MAQVINTGGSDSGSGAVIAVVLLIAVLIGGYFLFANGGFSSDSTTIEAPDVNISAPAIPGAD
ncbi:MAG: hypothetical protein ACT4OY_06420 [Alphaproteobacteria bacterium]